jgi:hypothetical protein
MALIARITEPHDKTGSVSLVSAAFEFQTGPIAMETNRRVKLKEIAAIGSRDRHLVRAG